MSEERVVSVNYSDIFREANEKTRRILEVIGGVNLEDDAGIRSAVSAFVSIVLVLEVINASLPEGLVTGAEQICADLLKEVAPIIAEYKANKELMGENADEAD